MPQQNSRQVRVVDPVLSNVAQGYRNADFVGGALFPRVPVMLSGGQILEFGKEAFRLYNSRRAPGANTKRVQFGHLGKPYALVQEALEGQVPREHMRDASRQPGIELGTRAVNNVMRVLQLGLEYEQAQLALDPNQYDTDHKVDLSGAPWTDDANNPGSDIRTGREAIRDTVGVYPNVALLSAKAFAAAQENAKVIERFKYTSRDSVTAEMLAQLWDLDRVVVGKAVSADEQDNMSDIWGNDVVLAYAPETPNSVEEPSYGYTYTMENHPIVESSYYDDNAKSWIYPITFERKPVITGMNAGYLMQSVG